MHNNLITIGNDGPEISETNYFDLEEFKRFFFLSTNAGTFRLLVPDPLKKGVEEMKTAYPFSITMSTKQADRIPTKGDQHSKCNFAVYTQDGKCLELPCYYRIVDELPYLKQRK